MAKRNLRGLAASLPNGSAVADFNNYQDAVAYVERIIMGDFPVSSIAIVGSNLSSVERIRTKISYGKIALNGAMMGVWFLATASSEFIASLLANIASVDTSNGTAMDLNIAKQSYLMLFEYLFYTGIGFGIVLLILSPMIKKLMNGVDKELNN